MPLVAHEKPVRESLVARRITDAPPEVHDFDIHGLVRIRLIGASPSNVKAVMRQLGLGPSVLSRLPDVTIRFVNRLSTDRLTLIGADAACNADEFFILRAKHKTAGKVLFPMADIGGRCEIVCERELIAVPLLIAIVNLTMLAKGVLPMHASAFQVGQTGVLLTGWAKGGKTEVLLGFAQRGGSYVGDEWVYIGNRGERMDGIPEPIRIWDWHLTALPLYRRALPLASRLRLRGLAALNAALRAAAHMGGSRSSWRRQFQRLSVLIDRQRYVQVPPARLFQRRTDSLSAPCDLMLFVASTDSKDVTVRPIAAGEIVRRMLFSLEEERRDLLSYYRKFRFAFPNRRNLLLEDAGEIERELATQMLAGKPAYLVEHPYPAPIGRICDAICTAVDDLAGPAAASKVSNANGA